MGRSGEARTRLAGLEAWLSSLRLKLGVVTVVALLPALIVLIFNADALRRARESEIKGLANSEARSVAAELNAILEGFQSTLRVVAQDIDTRDGPACSQRLAEAARQLPQFASIHVADEDGQILCHALPDDVTRSIAGRTYFDGARAADGNLYVGDFEIGKLSGKRVLPIALLIATPGQPSRILAATIDTDWLAARLRSRTLAKGSALTIADRNGVILFREPYPDRFIGTHIPADYMRLVDADVPGSELLRSQDGMMRYQGYVPPRFGPPHLYVSAGVAAESAFAFLNEALRLNLVLVGVAALGSVAAATYAGHRLVHRPLGSIMQVARSWMSGDLKRRTGMSPGQGEIGVLGAALDRMIDELAAREVDRRNAEEQRLILVRELQHRVKNTLAVVQAIAGQSLRGGAEMSAQVEAFRARLGALAQTYDVLTEENWRGAALAVVIKDALAAQFPDGRYTLAGPDLRIKPNAALAFSLALHELATNAMKYGALSTPAGHVDVAWTYVSDPPDCLALSWTETGGPPTAPPEREGFGSRLLNRILGQQLSGTTVIDWRPSGLVFRVVCPLDQLRDKG